MADVLIRSSPNPAPDPNSSGDVMEKLKRGGDGSGSEDEESGGHISVLAILVTIFRKSLVACRAEREKLAAVEIGWPTDVRHVAHVTFDRFNGFLGLPVEFEPEVPNKPPSASTSVFGVSTKSMQLSYDSRGNSVPTILLLMQKHLYSRGGLQAEGIFRINAENTQEEYVREQLNAGMVPEGVDVHCLAGLIKAWFRELPAGILDSLSPEQVMQCQSEDECAQLVKSLPQTEADLLDWAINLMADVGQVANLNKMNARNIAMVFAPNMTQMADPLTALMYAVHVMNFLKSLVLRRLREREQSIVESASDFHTDSPNEDGNQSLLMHVEECTVSVNEESERAFVAEEPSKDIFYDTQEGDDNDTPQGEARRHVFSNEKLCLDHYTPYDALVQFDTEEGGAGSSCRCNNVLSTNLYPATGNAKSNGLTLGTAEKHPAISNLTQIDSRPERTEAWR